MRAETVARRLLSFPRLSVDKVRFEADELGGEVLVIEVAVRGRSRCSRCGRKCPGYDRLKPRRWRHLDFGAWEVQIEATLARVECSDCGVVVERVSWAEPDSRFRGRAQAEGWRGRGPGGPGPLLELPMRWLPFVGTVVTPVSLPLTIVPVPIPCAPNLAGVTLDAQWTVWQPGTSPCALVPDFALSNILRLEPR